jgi:DNA modification methylase
MAATRWWGCFRRTQRQGKPWETIKRLRQCLWHLQRNGQKRDPWATTGSAARFFYCPKASKKDREGSTHPTMKPTDLMRYLCRLVTPPGGIVLDPFMGSGSTGKAAMLEGFRFIGIEREAEYVEIARARIGAVLS